VALLAISILFNQGFNTMRLRLSVGGMHDTDKRLLEDQLRQLGFVDPEPVGQDNPDVVDFVRKVQNDTISQGAQRIAMQFGAQVVGLFPDEKSKA
jgi:hypothetical protein